MHGYDAIWKLSEIDYGRIPWIDTSELKNCCCAPDFKPETKRIIKETTDVDLKNFTWLKGKYQEYLFRENKMQELSKICRDISVDMGYNEITMVTLTLPYDNLRCLNISTEIKEETNMPLNMHDEICKYFGLQTATPDSKPKWHLGLPAIKNVETYNNRVVKVTFIDGTFTKAVCSENDPFDLDVGITICAMKRIFGENGTRHYNNYIRHAHEVMEKNEQAKLAKAAKKEAEKARNRKAELKRAANKLKIKEEAIDIQKQAIIRAHQEIEQMQMEDDLK